MNLFEFTTSHCVGSMAALAGIIYGWSHVEFWSAPYFLVAILGMYAGAYFLFSVVWDQFKTVMKEK